MHSRTHGYLSEAHASLRSYTDRPRGAKMKVFVSTRLDRKGIATTLQHPDKLRLQLGMGAHQQDNGCSVCQNVPNIPYPRSSQTVQLACMHGRVSLWAAGGDDEGDRRVQRALEGACRRKDRGWQDVDQVEEERNACELKQFWGLLERRQPEIAASTLLVFLCEFN